MSKSIITTGGGVPRITVTHTFHPAGCDGIPFEDLFGVNAGAPIKNAVTEAALILGSIDSLLRMYADTVDDQGFWGCLYLLDAAKAALDAALMSWEAQELPHE